jgi:DnaK suppressor protein
MMKNKALSKSQQERMRADLLERQHWLLHESRGHLDDPSGEEADRCGDEADLANKSLHTDLALDARARESRELQLIDDALHKIDGGEYGTCGECGGSIAMARLEALPFAEFCIDCQEELERTGAPTDGAAEFLLD